MTKLICKSALGALCVAMATAAAAGEATIYSRSGFQGHALTLAGSDPNLANNGFDDVGSIVVHSGRWEFCARPGFEGRCESLGPGRYYSLREDWKHRVLSARDTTEPVPGPRASLELFPRAGFRGPATAIDRNVRFLERRGIDDNVSSLIVNEGVWELCSEPRFDGVCRTFEPGRYARLGPRLDNQVGSLRRVG
jgi:hypothetical protein